MASPATTTSSLSPSLPLAACHLPGHCNVTSECRAQHPIHQLGQVNSSQIHGLCRQLWKTKSVCKWLLITACTRQKASTVRKKNWAVYVLRQWGNEYARRAERSLEKSQDRVSRAMVQNLGSALCHLMPREVTEGSSVPVPSGAADACLLPREKQSTQMEEIRPGKSSSLSTVLHEFFCLFFCFQLPWLIY